MSERPAVLITGAAKRVGAHIAQSFSEAGWHVVIHYNRSDKAARTLADKLPSAEIVQCDLANEQALTLMIEGLAKKLTDWRCLINSAAIFAPDDVTALDSDTYDRAMQVNAKAPAMLAQAYLERATAAGGRRVIFITDQKLANPNPDFFSYTMSKHAVSGAIPMLAMGATRDDDRTYGLAPGAILPSHDQDSEEAEISHRMNLLGRRTGADEVAEAALFLASGILASGETLFVDSGQHLLRQPRDVIYLARGASAA